MKNIAKLTASQKNDWNMFVTMWDRAMLDTHGDDWPQVFAETIQHVVNALVEGGNRNALSDFMNSETMRVLTHTPVLTIPGIAPAAAVAAPRN